MPIEIRKIIEAAEKAGFDTELRVAAMLANAGWQTNQNFYFIDKDESKGRELDIRSYRFFGSTQLKPEVSCMITLCIEVKKTSDPFIFYTNNCSSYEGGQGYGLFHWKNRISSGVISFNGIEQCRPMRNPDRMARSYSSFKDGKTQHIQSGVISAFKSAIHQKEHCEEVYSDDSGDICFFIPIVVVDGPLYECYFKNGEETLSAQPIDRVVYLQNYQSNNYGRVSNSVYVMNLEGFEKILPQFQIWGEDMISTMAKNRKMVDSPENAIHPSPIRGQSH